MMELKAENARLSKEIDALKEKVTCLENSSPVDLSQSVVSQVIEETFVREKCQCNLIVYGVSESTSSVVFERIAHDKLVIDTILAPLKCSIPQTLKLARLGKPRAHSPRPI